jgi:hypothetical protein
MYIRCQRQIVDACWLNSSVHTGTAQNAGDLDKLDWDLRGIHFGDLFQYLSESDSTAILYRDDDVHEICSWIRGVVEIERSLGVQFSTH